MIKNNKPISPPKLGTWLLKLLCRKEYLDEVQGDLLEVFEWRLKEKGVLKAKVWYLIDVVSALCLFKLFHSLPRFFDGMFWSFIKSSFRSLSKNRLQTSLNVFGLAVGIAAALFILEYVSDELDYDRFSQSEDMYRVTLSFSRGDESMYKTAVIGEPIAEVLLNDLPKVEKAARLLDITRIWEGKNFLTLPKASNKTFEEPNLFFADPDIIDLFDLEILYGKSRLEEPNTVVLSEEASEKYFGSADEAIGQLIKFKSVRKTHDLLVTGVYRLPEHNIQVKPSLLVSYNTNLSEGKKSIIPMWGVNTCLTYIKTKSGTVYQDLQQDLTNILEKYQPINEENKSRMHISSLIATPIKSIHLNSDYQDEVGPVGDANSVYSLVVIAVFIVMMAWINYINLSTAYAIKRSREVGVRKVMGAGRGELISQFFIETFLINAFALACAIGMVLLIQPLFNQLIDRSLQLQTIDFSRFGVIMGSVFFTGIFVSGIYAALSLSSFGVVRALKGVSKSSSGQNIRRMLIVFQLSFSLVIVIVSLTMNSQLNFMNQADMGMDMNEVLVLDGPTIKRNDSLHLLDSKLLKSRLEGLAGIQSVTAVNTIPGKSILQSVAYSRSLSDNAEFTELELVTGNQYLNILSTTLVAGSTWSESDSEWRQVILNTSAVRQLGFGSAEEAVGKYIYGKASNSVSDASRIVGVIDDYHHESLNRDIDPMIFRSQTGRWDNYYLLKLDGAATNLNLYDNIEKVYAEVLPSNSVNYYYLGEFFKRQYGNDRLNNRVFMGFVLVAITIACLGLYGLTSFVALQKTKEIGVRKVFGAKLDSLVMLLSREVLVLSAIGFLLAMPVAYYGISSWLAQYAYHIKISWWLFVIPIITVLMVVFLAVGQQVFKAARANPINSLRYE